MTDSATILKMQSDSRLLIPKQWGILPGTFLKVKKDGDIITMKIVTAEDFV